MPVLIDRRGFLTAAAAGWMTRNAFAGVPSNIRWALLSDTHIAADANDAFRGFKPFDNLQTAVGQVKAKTFDGCLVNGDLARLAGHPEDYTRFGAGVATLGERGPAALSLGNHDERTHAIASLVGTAGEKAPVLNKWVSAIDTGLLRMIVLDSLLETNVTPGFLGKAQRVWLDTYLAAHADRPAIVFVHHTLDDSDTSLLDADKMLAILTRHRHVKAVFYGHSHAYNYKTLDGIHLVNLPAVGYNFVDSEPVGWVEAAMDAGGAQLTLHAFGGNREQDGQTRKIVWR